MGSQAFSRAWRFLSYRPIAKWSALTAAVATGLLYLALLVVLGLFADLIVTRGRVPAFNELPVHEQEEFLNDWSRKPPDERENLLKGLGPDQATAARLAATDPAALVPAEREAVWRSYEHSLLAERVAPEAAEAVSGPTPEPIPVDHGILSLVVRSRNDLYSPVVDWLAQGWPWSWNTRANESLPFSPYLTTLLAVAVLLALLRAIAMFVMTYAAAVATSEAVTRLRRAIYHHTFRLGTLAFRSLGPGEAVSIFTRQLEAVHDGLYTRITVSWREPVKFCLLLMFALLINFWLAVAFLLFAVLVWLVGGQVAAYFRRQERAADHRAAEQLALLQESLMMMRLVKTYLMEAFNQSRVERQLSLHAEAQMGRYRGEAIYRPLLVFLGTLAAVVLLYVAGVIVLSGRLRVASGITMTTALVSLYWPLVNWLQHRRYIRRGHESAVILFRFLDRPGEVGQVVGAEFLQPLSQSLEFDNVSLKEPGTGRPLLEGVTFKIRAGQKVALVGPDELEKHALIYLIPRFLDPNSGEIRIDDHNLRWVTFDSLRAQIAVVLQHNLVFNDTIANNIGCGDAGYDLPKIIEAAKMAHAHHFIQKLPRGYETVVGELGHTLRISEQFRIALARAILRDPAILIVEEPLAPLDDDAKALLDDTFARILPGRTVIFLPHRSSTIRSCDQVFLLHKGHVEAAGEHRELLAKNQLYRHLQYIEFNEFAEQT